MLALRRFWDTRLENVGCETRNYNAASVNAEVPNEPLRYVVSATLLKLSKIYSCLASHRVEQHQQTGAASADVRLLLGSYCVGIAPELVPIPVLLHHRHVTSAETSRCWGNPWYVTLNNIVMVVNIYKWGWVSIIVSTCINRESTCGLRVD